MKKFLLIVICLVFATVAFAQEGVNLNFGLVYNDALNSNLGGITGDQRVEYMTVAADTDGDGADEIICAPRMGGASPQGAVLEVYEATADDTYALSWSWTGDSSTFWRSNVMATGDLDGNGTKEIIMGVNSNVTDVLAIFENVGDNDWGTAPDLYDFPAVSGTTDVNDFASLVGCADVDADGTDELILVTTNPDDNIVIASVASGTFAADNVVWTTEYIRNLETEDKGSPYGLAIGDVDGDTYLDIVLACWDNLRVDIYEASAADTYALASSANLSAADDYSWYACKISDVDADGVGEVWVLNISDGLVYGAELSDVSTMTAASFSAVFDTVALGGGQINMAVGNQDSVSTLDGPDLYFVGGADDIVMDAEFNGGDPLDSANWTVYSIDAETGFDGDTLWMVEAANLDGDSNLELVYTRQDADGTRAGGLGTDKDAPSLFVQEFVIVTHSATWSIYQ